MIWRLRIWYWRLTGVIPKEEPRYGAATTDEGRFIKFDEPLTVWQSIARIGEEHRRPAD